MRAPSFRPSIIVGEQSSGWTASFNVLYPPLKGFEAGAYPALPASPHTPVDVVPVDYVADAIFELAERPAKRGEVHHLVAGERATTVGRLAQRAGRYFRRRPPRLLPPRLYRLLIHPLLVAVSRGRRRRALRSTEALFPYSPCGFASTTAARGRASSPSGSARRRPKAISTACSTSRSRRGGASGG